MSDARGEEVEAGPEEQGAGAAQASRRREGSIGPLPGGGAWTQQTWESPQICQHFPPQTTAALHKTTHPRDGVIPGCLRCGVG